MPSQLKSSTMARSNSGFERSTSVSSIPNRNCAPSFLANRKLSSAVRALPTCSNPVGDGAKRTSLVKRLLPRIAESVGDRITSIASEIPCADLHTRRRLAALVFRNIEEMFHPLHRRRIISLRTNLRERHLFFYEAFEDAVEGFVRRQ